MKPTRKTISISIELFEEIEKIKKEKGIPMKDKKREDEILEKLKKEVETYDVFPVLINKIYQEIFKESRKIQEKIN